MNGPSNTIHSVPQVVYSLKFSVNLNLILSNSVAGAWLAICTLISALGTDSKSMCTGMSGEKSSGLISCEMPNQPSSLILSRYSNALFLGNEMVKNPASSVVVVPAVSKNPFSTPFSSTCSSISTSKSTQGNPVAFSTTVPSMIYVFAQSFLQHPHTRTVTKAVTIISYRFIKFQVWQILEGVVFGQLMERKWWLSHWVLPLQSSILFLYQTWRASH